jgi:hypothetical protein
VCVCVRVCVRECVYACARSCMCAFMRICVLTCVYVRACVCACLHVSVPTQVCMHLLFVYAGKGAMIPFVVINPWPVIACINIHLLLFPRGKYLVSACSYQENNLACSLLGYPP